MNSIVCIDILGSIRVSSLSGYIIDLSDMFS